MKRRLSQLERLIRNGIVHGKGDGGEGGSGAGGAPAGDPENAGDPDDKGDPEKAGDPDGKGELDDKGGKGNLSEADAKLLRENMKRKRQVAELEDQLQPLLALRDAVGELSADDIKALITEKNEREIKEMTDRREFDAVVDRMRSENERAVQGVQSQLQAATDEKAKLLRQIEDLTVGRAFSDSEFVRKELTLPPSIARKEFDSYFDVQDGQVVPHDKPRGVEGRIPLVDQNGVVKSFDAAIAELVEKHPDAPRLRRSTQKPGAGSQTTQVPRQEKQNRPVSSLDKIASGLKNLGKS